MAKLVAVCRDDEFPFERRQIPLMIEETLTMVMEIPETIISMGSVSSTEEASFIKRYTCLSKTELHKALIVCRKDLFKLLAVMVPCVGCRKSVERLYNQLWESCQPAIEPLVITPAGVLSLKDNFINDIKLIYALFYIHGSNLNEVVDTIPKSKRNRRCILHSLETHKARASGSWLDVWDLLSQECRDEVVLIDSDSLLGTLENYLRKHRFCSECKSKVLRAYSILAGDVDGDAEKGYCAGLYEGLKSCPKDRHIHVVCDTEFIALLIGRAEPELAGGRRERHARTIDIAQEEVLTCLGIHLWERLHRLWQKLRAEEQTWQMLFYLGIEALRKSFETAVEEKQGISQLELVVEEISEAERVKEQRKENKRLKRKKRKEKLKAKNPESENHVEEEEKDVEEEEKPCIDEEDDDDDTGCHSDKEEKSSNDVCHSEDSGIQESHSESSVSSSSQESCSPSPSSQGSSVDISTSECKKSDKEMNNQSHLHNNDNNNSLKFNNGLLLKECPCPRKSKRNFNDSNSPQSVYYNQSYNKPTKYCSAKNKTDCISDCECDRDFIKHTKKGGFSQVPYNSRGSHRRNGYNNYEGSGYRSNYSTIGPRFKKLNQQHYEDSRRSASNEQGDTYSSYHHHHHHHYAGRGRGKHSGYRPPKESPWSSVQHSVSSLPGSNVTLAGNSQNRKCEDSGFESLASSSSSEVSSTSCLPPDVDNEDELRLLKIMGWNSDDNHGISEQEIKEFSESLCDMETQRQELRNNIREQFNKLTVNGLFCNC